MNEKLKEKIKESLSSVLPITVIVLLLSITLVPLEVGPLTLFLTGAVLLIVGIGLFQLGAEMAMTPLGQDVGSKLSKGKRIFPIILICFVIGAIITIAEPDLQVLANQVASIPSQVLIWTVAIGVGVFLAVAVLRIRFHISLRRLLAVCYILLFVLSFFSPSSFTSVAFDSGGVTTGPMTVPFIMALGVGLSAARSDPDGTEDSFGLVALCSISKRTARFFITWQFFLFLGELFLGKAPALALREKLLFFLINAVYLSLSSQKIRIQNFPASRMLSRASVLLRFVSAEIHLPF